MTALRAHPIRLILIAFVLLAGLYSVTTPLLEASDELWHYPMVKYMADNGIIAVPYQQPGADTPWRQEGSQPPLYYMMAAVLTGWIDTANLPEVRRINPHADIGLVLPDQNINMTIHDPAARSFPWRGAALAIHLARLFSVFLGAVTVWMTYRLGCELFPRLGGRQNPLALIGAALVAFNPMFLFISGSVNNDNLSNAVASALLVEIVRLLKRADAPRIGVLIRIGVLAGAGMLAKFNIGFLLPIIALALGLLAWRLRNWRLFATGAILTGGLTIGIAGWWYVRNWQLYGDPTGLNVFIQIVGPRPIPANWAQLWAERHTFLMSYWGFFGGVNVPLPEVVYSIFNAIAGLAVIGLIVGGIVALPRLRRPQSDSLTLLLSRIVTLLWIGVLFVGLIRWTSETWASQGRLMFSAIAPIGLWMALGLRALGQLIPIKRARWIPNGAAVAWFGAMAILGLLVIRDAYRGPTLMDAVAWENAAKAASASGSRWQVNAYCEGSTFRSCTDLRIGVAVPGTDQAIRRVQVGAYYSADLALLSAGPGRFTRDWSVFIHLETEQGLIVAQRDVYPGQGLWPTSLMPMGYWRNTIAVRLPDFAYAPQRLNVFLGFYDLKTGERLPPADGDGRVGDRLLIDTIELAPRTEGSSTPNPMQVNLGDQAELIGYSFSPDSLTIRPGQSVTATFYWRACKPFTVDYRVFAQIVEPNTTNVFGQSDAMPAGWTRPTTTWQMGEIIADTHTFTVPENARPGTWQLIVGMYRLIESPRGQEFQRLRIVAPDGGQAEDFIGLTRIRILPAE